MEVFRLRRAVRAIQQAENGSSPFATLYGWFFIWWCSAGFKQRFQHCERTSMEVAYPRRPVGAFQRMGNGSSPLVAWHQALISLRNRGFFFYAFEICAQNSRGVVLSFPAVIIKK